MHQQDILAEEASMERAGLEADVVAAEEQARADHFHGAADDGGARRVGGPLAVVGELACPAET